MCFYRSPTRPSGTPRRTVLYCCECGYQQFLPTATPANTPPSTPPATINTTTSPFSPSSETTEYTNCNIDDEESDVDKEKDCSASPPPSPKSLRIPESAILNIKIAITSPRLSGCPPPISPASPGFPQKQLRELHQPTPQQQQQQLIQRPPTPPPTPPPSRICQNRYCRHSYADCTLCAAMCESEWDQWFCWACECSNSETRAECGFCGFARDASCLVKQARWRFRGEGLTLGSGTGGGG